MIGSLERSKRGIHWQFDELGSLVPLAPIQEESVSHWSIGHHLDHMLKVDREVVQLFEKPAAGPLRPLTPGGWLVLTSGWIPRGRGRAPETVLPSPRPAEELAAEILAVRDLVGDALSVEDRLADPRPIAQHPIFGGLSAARWVRFLYVHHHHHLKIVRDVQRAGAR